MQGLTMETEVKGKTETISLKELEEKVFEMKFNTRGLPFAKKMWRDGYNKALQDLLTRLTMG